MRGGFRGGVHSVLRHFVDSARGRLLVESEEMVERARAFADGVGFFDGLGDVSLRKNHRFLQLLPAGQLRGDG